MQTLLTSALGALMLSGIAVLPAQADDATKFMTEFYKIADARPFDASALSAQYADDFVDHDFHGPADQSHKQASIELFTSLATGAPDSRHEISFIESVGENKALVRWRFKGTHTGEMLGIPATNKSFDIAALELWEIKNGKIVGLHHVEEIANLLQQLGLAE
jgi:steroid delta-isomerase-like uncharacterized protein